MAPSPLIGAYNVSKAALIHITRQLALEMAPTVRVNAVAPAVVKTALAGDEMTIIVSKCQSGNVPVPVIEHDPAVIRQRFMDEVAKRPANQQ